jgi:hypothetical protein
MWTSNLDPFPQFEALTADTVFVDPVNSTSVATFGDTYSGVFVLNSCQLLGKARVYCNEQFKVITDLLIDDSTLMTNEVQAGTITTSNGGVLSHP